MIRRFLVTASLIVCVCTSIWAAERATFVFTNGERKSGTVVFHGSQGNNVIDDHFNLNINGNEETYPASQIAAIDFAGGQPSIPEQQALLKDQANVLAFRNGQVELGRFVNLVNGVTVVWQNAAGAQVNLPISDVSRIYLNLGSARNAYGVTGTPANTASAQLAPGSIRVNGNVPWVDSGIVTKRGERLTFHATGDVNAAPGASAGPAGTDVLRGSYPVKSVGAGGLIGRINNGTPFKIGSSTLGIPMPAAGRLMLGINDDYLGDNDGYFIVTITRQ